MKRRAKLATIFAVGMAVTATIGGALTAGTATASSSNGSQSPVRQGMHSQMMGDGMLTTEPSGTLTADQKATLAKIAEDEKLARDLYAKFAARYDAWIFDRIGTSETHHLDAVRGLMDTYGVADPTAGKAPGVFVDPAIQETYDRLLAQGNGSLDEALEAGVAVEVQDIADLTNAMSGLTAPDVEQVYTNLREASQNHKAAFTNWLNR